MPQHLSDDWGRTYTLGIARAGFQVDQITKGRLPTFGAHTGGCRQRTGKRCAARIEAASRSVQFQFPQ